jgi:hypothetical protein
MPSRRLSKHRAQPNAQQDKKRAIENHEEIIEAEIEPQAEGNKRRCQVRAIGFNRARSLEKILRTARGQDRNHHAGNRQRGECCQDGEHTIQRPDLHDIPLPQPNRLRPLQISFDIQKATVICNLKGWIQCQG